MEKLQVRHIGPYTKEYFIRNVYKQLYHFGCKANAEQFKDRVSAQMPFKKIYSIAIDYVVFDDETEEILFNKIKD